MKTLYSTLGKLAAAAVLLAMNSSAFSQWTATTSQTISGYFRIDAIHFINTTVGFVGGSNALSNGNGIISKTSNGGASWTTVATIASSPVQDIYFVNSTLGFAVGTKGLIAKTTDGGNTWLSQNYTNPNTLQQEVLTKVRFVDQNTGYISGGFSDMIVLKTTDGGTTWNQLTMPTSYFQRLKSLYFLDANNGFVVGGDQFSGGVGRIGHTSDGGNTWDTLPSGVTDHFYDIIFMDSNNGLIGCADDGKILKTSDGGLTWNQVINPAGTAAVNEFSFINSTMGYACTNGGKIIKTIDGGNTWTVDGNVSSLISSLYAISVVSSTVGFSVGLGGLYAKMSGGTGSSDLFSENNVLTIFPNPFTTSTTFKSNENFINATLTIYNSFGQTVKQIKNISGQTVTLFRDNLASGLYFLRLTEENKIIAVDKLVITD